MRLSVVLLVVSLAGVLAGGWLIGRWALGLAVIVDSAAVAVYALRRDYDDRPRPSVHDVPTLAQVLEKARHAS
jgi:hypothetical protein